MKFTTEWNLVLVGFALIMGVVVVGLPAPKKYCPVIKSSDLGEVEAGDIPPGSKIIHMDKVTGGKVRLHFFYPNQEAMPSRRRLEDDGNLSSDDALATTTTFNNEGELTTTTFPTGDSFEESTSVVKTEDENVVVTSSEHAELFYDIFCQWEFKANNDSQFLLLTFEALSAPYSENCATSYVAMQKQNAFESRWCGNRRQANARPMALFSRGSAKVSVYHGALAPRYPPTGFTVFVETLDASAIDGRSTLRILTG